MIQLTKVSALPRLEAACTAGFPDRVQVKEAYAKAVKEWKGTEFSVDFAELAGKAGVTALRDAVEGMLLGTYRAERFPAAPRTEWKIDICGVPAEGEAVIRETETIVEGIFWARDMVNKPGNLLRPMDFAGEAEKLFAGLPAEVEILDAEQLKEKGFRSIYSVGMSSAFPPCLCIIRYKGNPADDKITGLVGKGVTCDTGGYCLKSADSMGGIKGDMAGGAAVIGAVYALAKNKVRTNVTALVPMVENRLSDSSLLPGDVIRSYSGKTIEIVNTDAEGRLILADAVAYAARNEGIRRVLDIATLTGSVCAALGFGAAATVGDDEEFCREFANAGELSGERYLRLPIYAEYEKMIKSEIADVKNLGGRHAGTITAGLFIRAFAEGLPWLHLDIAGTAWANEPVFEYQAKGATGAGLTTMYYLCAEGEG